MKNLLIATVLAAGLMTAFAADKKDDKSEKKPYPLKTCVVSDEKLGEMGKPYVYKYKGRELQFCCSNCVKDFNKNPDKYLKKLDDAEKKADKK